MNQVRRLAPIEPWTAWNANRLRAELESNPRAFARGFQMRAFADEERKFPSFGTCFTPGVLPAEIARRGWPVFAGVDLSGPKRPGNVIFVAALDPSSQRRYPLEVLTGNWTSPQTAQQLQQVNLRHPNLRIVMVENNGYQQAIIDWVRSSPGDHSFWYKVEAFTTGENKTKADIGLPSLEVEFKNRAWVVPSSEFEMHQLTCQCGWCTWTREVRDYPHSAATDTVMAMWFCREGMSRWGALAAGASPGNQRRSSDFNVR